MVSTGEDNCLVAEQRAGSGLRCVHEPNCMIVVSRLYSCKIL